MDNLETELRDEIEQLTLMKAQADRGLDLLTKAVQRREDVIKEKETEIARVNHIAKEWKHAAFAAFASATFLFIVLLTKLL